MANSNTSSPTEDLARRVSSANLEAVPESIRTRAKHLILDGLACALVGAHLPWSTTAANAILDMESAGASSVFGWNRKIGPLPAALLNSTFIQGFELDDWHSEAPLHSNSILLPALFSASEHLSSKDDALTINGADFLLATIVGYEVGPRVGNALWGSHILSEGWHSGAVFGPAAAAAAVGRLMNLSAGQIEDAFGIACTQACGLMSAQFGSEVKRMQHGFAARNGLLAALLAKGGYVGIKKVFEVEYGGFLNQFSLGNGQTPQYRTDEVVKELGTKWQTNGINVKPYASMAGTHSTVDCIRKLQDLNPEQMRKFNDIKNIKIELGEDAFHHGGWKAVRPLTSLGAQMNDSYVAATQIIDGEVLVTEFKHDMLERDELWRLVDRTECVYTPGLGGTAAVTITIDFENGESLTQHVKSQKGVDPPLSNGEIVQKWRSLTNNIIEKDRQQKIEEIVLGLESCENIALLGDVMAGMSTNPIV